ncbi:fatty acid hydroxylase [Nannochloropsis oceanica]
MGPLQAIQTWLAPGPAPLSPPHRSSSSSSPSFPSPVPSSTTSKPLVDVRQLSLEDATLRFPSADFAVPTTLPSALFIFFSHPSIILILVGIASLSTGRLLSSPLLPPSLPHLLFELTLIPVTVTGWMLQEWSLHRFLLHSSLPWPGREIHAQHHALPFYHVSIDPPLLVAVWGAVACGAGWLMLPQPWVWTVLGTYWLMGLLYEWAHFSVHTRVRPRTALGKAVKAHHTKHHLKCDGLWFAFSWPWIDTVMGTVPGREGG